MNSNIQTLLNIQEQNPPNKAIKLDKVEKIYQINLKARTVESPEFLSVQADHQSSIIYFMVDRYYNYMDLSETSAVIEYYPAGKEKSPYIYVVPFFDTATYADENKMVFPWEVRGAVTQFKGDIEFAIRFFRIETVETELEDGTTVSEPKLVYNLNIQPGKSRILPSLELNDMPFEDYKDLTPDRIEELVSQIANQRTMWTVL